MMNSFWWENKNGSFRRINWLNWEKLTMKKDFGGLGFRHLHGFNLAMLGKKGGNFSQMKMLLLLRCSKLNFFIKEVSWMSLLGIIQVMYGVASMLHM